MKMWNFLIVYQRLIRTINKIERGFIDKPALMSLSDTKELISEIDSIIKDCGSWKKNLCVIKTKTRMSYTEILSPVTRFERIFNSLSYVIGGSIALICALSHKMIFYKNHNGNLASYTLKKSDLAKNFFIDGYKDIICELQAIEEMVFKRTLVDDRALMEEIEKLEFYMDSIFEGTIIVKQQRRFSYYDVVLLMNRFHCGLAKSLFIVEEIADRASQLGYAIYEQQELVLSQNELKGKSNDTAGAQK